MRKICYFNLFALGLPILLAFMSILMEDFLIYALISTILTGLIQVILGLCLLFKNPLDKNPKIYLGSVMVYFLLWFMVSTTNLAHGISIFVFTIIPPILAIYLTIIISNNLKSRV